QQRTAILDRDRVFEFLPGMAEFARLEVQPGPLAGDAHAHRCLHARPGGGLVHRRDVVEVTLGHRDHLVRGRTPAVAGDQELPLDLYRHAGFSWCLFWLMPVRRPRWIPRAPYAGTCPSRRRPAASSPS